MLLALLALTLAQEPTIRVPVRLVTIPTLVFSQDNHLLPDLRATHFRVLDNGVPQSVTVEESTAPISIAVVIQANIDVRDYLPFIAKTGSVIETLIAADSAAITYGDEVTTIKSFDSGDLSAAMKAVRLKGRDARMIDAALRAADLLAARPPARSRVLLVVGQPLDKGSESKLDPLIEAVERNNIAVFTLSLPLMGKAFVSDTFSLQGVTKAERGGYRASTDFKNLIRILSATSAAVGNTDPFAALTAATGGTQLHFRTQRQLEDGLGAIGFQLQSAYALSYYPTSTDPGHHAVTVGVDIPGAKVYARPGYWRAGN